MKDNLELTKAQVQAFLNRFHALTPSYRRMVIESLTTEDYVDGPVI